MSQCLDLVLLTSPQAVFLLHLIFGPCIFNFLVKFVSPSSSMTRISPGQHPDSTGTSCLITLWTLISLCKCTLGPQAILPLRSYMGDHPSDRKAQGRPPATSWPGDVPTSPGPGKVFHHIPWETLERTPIPLNNWVHPYQPGDEIWVKDWKKEPFQPIWTGPHMVILRTPTADKVTDIPWIYHPRVKKAAASCDEDPWKAVWDSKSLLKVQFQRQQPSPEEY